MSLQPAHCSLAGLRGVKIALIHDWLTGMRGGERCLEVFCELLPQAQLYTLFHFPGEVSAAIEALPIHTSFLQRLPALERTYRYYLPLFPAAVSSFDLSQYDFIISLSHAVAKGAGHGLGIPHLSYCFTPMRYVWEQRALYFSPKRYPRPILLAIEASLKWLKKWDAATHPHHYIAISRHVAGRIRAAYNRDSDVLYPPVDVGRFRPRSAPEDFYLIVSAFAPYKRIELAIEACNRLGRNLVIVGKGEEGARLERLAGSTVSFLGWRSDEKVAELMARCRALILPGEEDFGIAPLEAMAAGRPVIAYGRGGATETVIDFRRPGGQAPTGIWFDVPEAGALLESLLVLERHLGAFEPALLRRHAERFSRERFREEIGELLRAFLNLKPGPSARVASPAGSRESLLSPRPPPMIGLYHAPPG